MQINQIGALLALFIVIAGFGIIASTAINIQASIRMITLSNKKWRNEVENEFQENYNEFYSALFCPFYRGPKSRS